jgi:hypothetical protein
MTSRTTRPSPGQLRGEMGGLVDRQAVTQHDHTDEDARHQGRERPRGHDPEDQADRQADPGAGGRAGQQGPPKGPAAEYPLLQAQTGADDGELLDGELMPREDVDRMLSPLALGKAGQHHLVLACDALGAHVTTPVLQPPNGRCAVDRNVDDGEHKASTPTLKKESTNA